MKNKFSLLAAAAFSLLALGSCEKDEDQLVATISPAPTLTASTANAGVLASPDATKDAVTYTWTPVTFAFSDGSKNTVPVTYTLEFAKTGTNFATIGTVPAGENTSSITVKVADLNTALVKAGLTPTVSGTADVRLRATYAGNQTEMLSPASKITATAYSRDLFVFGTSIGALGTGSPYVREIAGKPAQYEGYIWVPAASNTFKLSNTNTASGTIFGNAGGNNTISSTGTTTEFTLAGPKMYRVQINLSAGTFKADVTEWGIVGAATTNNGDGWSKSVPMTYDTKDKVWKLTGVTLPGEAGGNLEFKFRANDAWDINFGGVDGKSGELSYGGSNLKTSGSGKYDVTLNLNDPEKYTYSIAKK
ncbi:SusE domain-containing protein [Hymenobacter chitinivorans]|uniref:SusE-like outer membrane protein n=1 Tax=Hymenobacter chitinivorans DSM 11115 TaxID=1121954 RepID=A0A2M9BNZ1_9BACT|nr:SusE domain-containing protein [Hymenobacter chitinivorans]PJJ59652.1 SusE-like outer membrane protein [Hymenobacter chitinivorans DSM 11115]